MTLEKARELLDQVRAGEGAKVSVTKIRKALMLTGDLKPFKGKK